MERARRQGLTATGRDPLNERGDDLYETPLVAVHALLKHVHLPTHIWEPAAGKGAISTPLREAGKIVYATDLVDHGDPLTESRIDFLMEFRAPIGCDAIVTNPPFKLADQFVRHALFGIKVPMVVMLLRLAFLEGTGRYDVLDIHSPVVYLFRNRLPRMHRAGWTGNRASSSIAFAWYVWTQEHKGPLEVRRITWEDPS